MRKSTKCLSCVLCNSPSTITPHCVRFSQSCDFPVSVCLQLKMVQAARDGLDHRYQSLTGSLKDWEGQLKQLLTRKTANTDDDMCAEEEEDNTVPWLNPPRGTLQASLDYAKQLSEKAYNSLGSVTVASRFLPGNLRENADLAYERAQNMYSTLKPVWQYACVFF